MHAAHALSIANDELKHCEHSCLVSHIARWYATGCACTHDLCKASPAILPAAVNRQMQHVGYIAGNTGKTSHCQILQRNVTRLLKPNPKILHLQGAALRACPQPN